MGRLLNLVRAAAACLAFGGPALAEGPLRELSTSEDGKGWEAVGRINIGGTGYCTGALIEPDLVLTAAHCLYDPHSGDAIEAGKFEFLAGWRNGRAEAYRHVRRMAAHPDYVYEGRDRVDRVAYDLALLELDQPIRNPSIRPFATAERANRGDEVGVVSYATGRDEVPSLEEVCEVLGRESKVLILSCDVDFGASGSPIFIFEDGEARIVSVVSAKARFATRRVALAAELGEALGAVRDVLNSSGGVFRRATPGFRPVPAEAPPGGGGATLRRDGAKVVRP